jgi:hypothetical protein
MRQNHGVPGRRLILLLVVLLVTLSVLSAGRDISRRGPAGQATTTTATPTAPAEREAAGSSGARDEGGEKRRQPAGNAVERRLPSTDPVRVRLGQRVVLRVNTREPDIITVDELGIRAPTGPGTTGTLDFVAGSTGTYPVTLAVGERRIGELSVRD